MATLSLTDDKNEEIYFAKALEVCRKAISDYDIGRLVFTIERLGFTSVTSTKPIIAEFMETELSLCGKFALECKAEQIIRSAIKFLEVLSEDVPRQLLVDEQSCIHLLKETELQALRVFRVTPLAMREPTPIYAYYMKVACLNYRAFTLLLFSNDLLLFNRLGELSLKYLLLFHRGQQ